MAKKSINFTGASAWAVVICFALICGIIGYAVHGIVAPATKYIDCSMCGAHVNEWWYVQDSNGSPTEICAYCYQLYLN